MSCWADGYCVLCRTKFLLHLGAYDKNNNPVIFFPSNGHADLGKLSVPDLVSLLKYMSSLTSPQPQQTGHTFVANLQKATAATVTRLIGALQHFEVGQNRLIKLKPTFAENLHRNLFVTTCSHLTMAAFIASMSSDPNLLKSALWWRN